MGAVYCRTGSSACSSADGQTGVPLPGEPSVRLRRRWQQWPPALQEHGFHRLCPGSRPAQTPMHRHAIRERYADRCSVDAACGQYQGCPEVQKPDVAAGSGELAFAGGIHADTLANARGAPCGRLDRAAWFPSPRYRCGGCGPVRACVPRAVEPVHGRRPSHLTSVPGVPRFCDGCSLVWSHEWTGVTECGKRGQDVWPARRQGVAGCGGVRRAGPGVRGVKRFRPRTVCGA